LAQARAACPPPCSLQSRHWDRPVARADVEMQRSTARPARPPLKRLAIYEGNPCEDDDVVVVSERHPHSRGPGDQRASLHPRKELRCYEVLGLQRGADVQEVRTAYRQRALEAHPDRPRGSQAAFLSVAEAFETLSDRSAREVYDRELVISDSPDGLDAPGARRASSSSTTSEVNSDPQKVCQALVSMSMSDWNRHVSGLSSQVLEEARRHLTGGIDGVNGARRKGRRCPLALARRLPQQFASDALADNVLKSVAKGMHLYNTARGRYWFAQICVGGLTIRSHLTKCTGTAADGHIALLAYKELLLLHGKKDEQCFDVYFRQARAAARSQNIDPYGDQFSYFFVKTFPAGGGVPDNKPFCVRTPCVKDLDTALAHRREILEMLERGSSRKTVQTRISRLRAEVKDTQKSWKVRCSNMEQQLAGYIMRELEQRNLNLGPSAPKRRRLLGKQSQALMHLRLPWFSRFAAQNGMSRPELLKQLKSLQDTVERSPHLQDCVQRALQRRVEDPDCGHLALVDEINREPGSSHNMHGTARSPVLTPRQQLPTNGVDDFGVALDPASFRDKERSETVSPAVKVTKETQDADNPVPATEASDESMQSGRTNPDDHQRHEVFAPLSDPAVTTGVSSSSSGAAKSSASEARASGAETPQAAVEDLDDEQREDWSWTSELFPDFQKLQRRRAARQRQKVVKTPGPVIMEVDSD